MHCDETDDPASRFVEVLAQETVARDMQGRVTGSHLTSMHSVDNAYFAKLIGLLVEARLHVVSNPLLNMITQARADTYPKRRGLTRVKELMAACVNVSFGHDCTLDPWYPLGAADMLDVAMMGLHACHMSGEHEIGLMFDAVTCAIPGGKRPAQVADNCGASDVPPLSAETMAAIRDIYDTRIRQSVHQRW